jgi:hypothetical protein
MMIASRAATRAAARTVRRTTARNVRFASTEQKTAAATGGSSGLVGGLAGGALVFGVSFPILTSSTVANPSQAGYGYYHFSGAKTIVDAASSTKAQINKLSQEISNSAPEPNEALQWLKSTSLSYAAFVPGAKGYVESAFKDLEEVQQKHGDKVEKIVQKAYSDMKGVTNKGMSMETAMQSWEILENAMTQLGELAADSASEILDNHPQLKEKVGSNLDQLKKLAENGGEDAKKELDATYKQIKDVIAGGISAGSIEKVRKLIQEKSEKLQSLGEEAWKKGMEQAKPYFDKNPELKKIVEENADSLKNGNWSELLACVKDAASSGNTDRLQAYVKDAGEKAKKSPAGQSIMQYAKMIPGGDEILPKLQKLQEVSRKRGGEAEKILKGAYEDVQEVLSKRIGEVEKLADKAEKDAKN